MTDSPDNDWLDVPLKVAEINVTPGCHVLSVVDLDTGKFVPRVTKVDCEAGLVWILNPGFHRAHGQMGRFKLMCRWDDYKQYIKEWQSWK